MPCPVQCTIVGFVILGVLTTSGCSVEAQNMSQPPFPQRVKVQPFPEGLEWINAARPLQLSDLRGKFVLLDFWAYCCINCMHVLPELRARLRGGWLMPVPVAGNLVPGGMNALDDRGAAGWKFQSRIIIAEPI